MSASKPSKCKICGHEHWNSGPHVWNDPPAFAEVKRGGCWNVAEPVTVTPVTPVTVTQGTERVVTVTPVTPVVISGLSEPTVSSRVTVTPVTRAEFDALVARVEKMEADRTTAKVGRADYMRDYRKRKRSAIRNP